ncbi:hypothetical protein [Nostoc sp.]|uniref:hypothetical protein n=1 Tax=Nostoc sp. TaxID=1180 RepID=UPI002FF61665
MSESSLLCVGVARRRHRSSHILKHIFESNYTICWVAIAIDLSINYFLPAVALCEQDL